MLGWIEVIFTAFVHYADVIIVGCIVIGQHTINLMKLERGWIVLVTNSDREFENWLSLAHTA